MEEWILHGVITNSNMSFCSDIYVPYEILSEESKNRVADDIYVTMDLDYQVIIFASEYAIVVNKDVEKFIADWSNIFKIEEVKPEYLENLAEIQKNDTLGDLGPVKNILCFITAFFSLIAVFETIRLAVLRQKKEIAIMWSMGYHKMRIFTYLIQEFCIPILIGAAGAFLLEWGVYFGVLHLDNQAVLRYGLYSLASILALTLIIIALMLTSALRKPVIMDIKSEE